MDVFLAHQKYENTNDSLNQTFQFSMGLLLFHFGTYFGSCSNLVLGRLHHYTTQLMDPVPNREISEFRMSEVLVV